MISISDINVELDSVVYRIERGLRACEQVRHTFIVFLCFSDIIVCVCIVYDIHTCRSVSCLRSCFRKYGFHLVKLSALSCKLWNVNEKLVYRHIEAGYGLRYIELIDLMLDLSHPCFEFIDRSSCLIVVILRADRLDILSYYLKNPTNNGKYTVDDIKEMEGKIIDTRMNDLRIYDGRCPTLRAQRDGVLYVKNHTIYQLTGYEALLLQGFPKEYADKVKNEVSDRHLLMQAGNAMTVNVIKALGCSIKNFIESEVH